MRILILGGTVFLSAELARQAVEGGHDVTCLARGTAGRPPAGVDFVQADRALGTEAYVGLDGEWDEVLDVSWRPDQVRDALAVLAPRSRHWTYVSSCSVYADHATPGADESAALLPALTANQRAEDFYGEAKVTCEQLSRDAVGPRLHICRPGLIAGPGDVSDRFGYWLARFGRGHGPVLVPDAPAAMVQMIDVRDLAGWVLDGAENRLTGRYNAVGNIVPLTIVLGSAVDITGYCGRIYAADPRWLAESGVTPWSGPRSLPLWLPKGMEGFATRSAAAALERGLAPRPLDLTMADILADERARGLDRDRRAGLTADAEQELVHAWEAARNTDS